MAMRAACCAAFAPSFVKEITPARCWRPCSSSATGSRRKKASRSKASAGLRNVNAGRAAGPGFPSCISPVVFFCFCGSSGASPEEVAAAA